MSHARPARVTVLVNGEPTALRLVYELAPPPPEWPDAFVCTFDLPEETP